MSGLTPIRSRGCVGVSTYKSSPQPHLDPATNSSPTVSLSRYHLPQPHLDPSSISTNPISAPLPTRPLNSALFPEAIHASIRRNIKESPMKRSFCGVAPLGYVSAVISQVWRALLQLAYDSCPRVSSLARVVTAHIVAKVTERRATRQIWRVSFVHHLFRFRKTQLLSCRLLIYAVSSANVINDLGAKQ